MDGDYSYEVEVKLGRILARFDEEDKESLAFELADSLGIEYGRERFSARVARLLGRDLAPDEVFKLDVLQRAYEAADFDGE